MDELIRSRRRWRAIALALAAGHLVVLIAAFFFFTQLRLVEAQARLMEEQAREAIAAEQAARAFERANRDAAGLFDKLIQNPGERAKLDVEDEGLERR